MMQRVAAIGTGLAYALFYLFSIDDVMIEPRAEWFVQAGAASVERILTMRSPFLFEAIALVEAGWLVLLLSPMNLLIALGLGALVAVNVHGAIMLYKAPQACGISQASSASSAVPALLAGSACCAPSLLLVLGIPALGAFAGLFGYLIPLSAAALIASRIWQRRRGAPAMWAPIAGSTP
ncbi:hypothetical protein [Aquisalimonas sp.]|uniref:hypothetical protein n=1 Tax=Aquisalimonas sp. TaxID=1872621 RepID=UPI0025BF467F|nr:hypothetical protein [Aquisalimonas sp.]